MRVVARRQEGFAHEVEIEGGHRLVIDEPANVPGGTDLGPSPTRLVAGALAGCVAVTMEMYAERKGWELGPVEVGVDVSYEGYVPGSFDVSLRLPADLSEEQKQRLTDIARRCPVHKLLADKTAVTFSDRVEPL